MVRNAHNNHCSFEINLRRQRQNLFGILRIKQEGIACSPVRWCFCLYCSMPKEIKYEISLLRMSILFWLYNCVYIYDFRGGVAFYFLTNFTMQSIQTILLGKLLFIFFIKMIFYEITEYIVTQFIICRQALHSLV